MNPIFELASVLIEHSDVIRSALKVQLKRLEKDKEDFTGETPLYLVLQTNEELFKIRKLLRSLGGVNEFENS